MLVPIIVTLGVWLLLEKRGICWKMVALLIGILVTGSILWSATWDTVITQPLDSNQTLEVNFPASFPFTVHRIVTDDSEGHHIAVAHRIVLGYPDGLSIHYDEVLYYQGEFDRAQKLICAILLGMFWFFGAFLPILGNELYRYHKQNPNRILYGYFYREKKEEKQT
jgi:hypothetical protein